MALPNAKYTQNVASMCYMNAWNGRGSDPENFGARITSKMDLWLKRYGLLKCYGQNFNFGRFQRVYLKLQKVWRASV
jgi:hypothetical protein